MLLGIFARIRHAGNPALEMRAMEELKENIIAAEPTDRASPEGKRSYERSTIEFPYHDLDDAISVAKSVYKTGGIECDSDALAAVLGHVMTSGAFRGRVSNAGTFRLTENSGGKIRLTELGRQITQLGQEPEGRVQSFLSVPLFQKVFERYKGYTLPPAAALEREMVALGVSSKQTDKARQAFMRSARQAGFFVHGEDRLVKPQLSPSPTTKPIDNYSEPVPSRQLGGDGGGKPPVDPLIKGLVDRLPPSDAVWSLRDRAKWLQTATNAFDLIYILDEKDLGEITITLNRLAD